MKDKIRQKWRLLRLFRFKNSYACDYRIIQTFSHIMRKAT